MEVLWEKCWVKQRNIFLSASIISNFSPIAVYFVIGVDDAGIVGIALVKVDAVTKHMPQNGFTITRSKDNEKVVDGDQSSDFEYQERAYFFRPKWWVDECPVTQKPIIP